MSQAKATYAVKSWKRKPWENKPAEAGAHLSSVEMIHTYQGDIEGEGIIQYLFCENGDGKGSFVALEQVSGSVGGRMGSFVLQHSGTFDNGRITQTSAVVPGSGAGELIGISGHTTFEGSQHQEQYLMTLDYEV